MSPIIKCTDGEIETIISKFLHGVKKHPNNLPSFMEWNFFEWPILCFWNYLSSFIKWFSFIRSNDLFFVPLMTSPPMTSLHSSNDLLFTRRMICPSFLELPPFIHLSCFIGSNDLSFVPRITSLLSSNDLPSFVEWSFIPRMTCTSRYYDFAVSLFCRVP